MSADIESAMVMAAGLGKRMRPLTATRPKPLVRVAGKPLIDHAFERIADAGIGHVVVNVHYLADALEAHLRGGQWPFAIDVSDERSALLETGGGLVKAAPMLRGEPILCANSDNIWTDGPRNAIDMLAERWDDATMDALLLVVPQARANGHAGRGDFHMDPVGRLTRRQPGKIAPFVFTGVQLFSRRLLVDPPAGAFSTMVFWERAIAKGRLFGMSHGGSWFDVGSPASIPIVEAALNDG
jgi:MurNAc alpha-1-phosphate uridylyltransferase